MANLKLTHIVLTDGFPGEGNQNLGIPTDGWDNTTENCNTSDITKYVDQPPIPLGQKRTIYSDASAAPGMYTMAYLAYHDYSAVDISGDYSDGPPFCAHADTTREVVIGEGSTPPYYMLARAFASDAWDGTKGAPMALPCSTSIAGDSSLSGDNADRGYGYGLGWFWVGGVCPVNDVSLFRGSADSKLGADTTATLTEPGPMMIAIDTARAVIAISDTTASIAHGFGDMSAE